MRLFKRGKVYYTHVGRGAARRQVSTGCHDKRAAEIVARRLEREAADPDHARTASATLGDALGLLRSRIAEEAKAGKRSQATADFYRVKSGTLSRLLEHTDDGVFVPFPLAQLHARDVDAYISKRREEGTAESTIHKELVTLRQALKLAKRAGIWRGDIGELIPPGFAPEYKPKKTHVETPLGLGKLLAELLPDHAARVAFIVATSADLGDTDRALRTDVDMRGRRSLIRGTKTATRERVVPLARPWQVSLMRFALQHAQGEEGRLFKPWTNIRRTLADACQRAGIERVSPKDLRRTTSSWLRKEGAPPDLIALVMGHATSKMVELVYGRLSVEDLAGLLGGASPVHQLPASSPNSPDSLQRIGLGFPRESVPGPGIEPGTRGFSSRVDLWGSPRKDRRKAPDCIAGASQIRALKRA